MVRRVSHRVVIITTRRSSNCSFPCFHSASHRFWANEARYRTAHKEWVDFIDTFLVKLQEVDDEIPYLPAKDVEHRIYRDVRFSNDKTPYKRVSDPAALSLGSSLVAHLRVDGLSPGSFPLSAHRTFLRLSLGRAGRASSLTTTS
jgi:hypothetical protein